ncbi:Hsp20/alpha crystallin family protein [Alkalihalobacillus sp. R86527]|uniref:Hsp20/alpha crystallin family protein n=1 Tax=Alkalihalobacillus sp. R86527 TaxID=3093863 RepID=UPI00366E5011
MGDHWSQMYDWKNKMNKFMGDDFWTDFQDMFVSNGPLVNLYEAGNELICTVYLPGITNINDVDVYIHYRTLKVKGQTKMALEGYRNVQEEYKHGPFERIVELPFPVREKPIDATYKRGILMVHLHRLIDSKEDRKRLKIKDDESREE